MTRKRKTSDKIITRMADLIAVNMAPEAATLDQQVNIEITRAGAGREGRKVQADSARRLDAFAALRDGMAPGAYDAARRLERDILTRRGERDRGRPLERVDGDSPKDETDRRIAAGQRIDAIREKLSTREFWLLSELIVPSPQRDQLPWRAIVHYITGEDNHNAQGAVVRMACDNLREAYEIQTAQGKAA